MTWSSAYNELMCPLFLLAALALFIRYTETGQRKFWWWQLVVFSLGFGALEINIVYPAIAAAWVLFERPRRTALPRFASLVPLAGISAVYFPRTGSPRPCPASGLLRAAFRSLLFSKPWLSTGNGRSSPEPMERFGHRHITDTPDLLIGAAAIAGFVVTELRQRRFGVLFCLIWFSLPWPRCCP